MRMIYITVLLLAMLFICRDLTVCQVETVPISNQVYEFLERMAVKGVLPLYTNAMIPLSRKEVADNLVRIGEQREKLSTAEMEFLRKFQLEFSHEIDPASENNTVLLRDPVFHDILSDREKYLYQYTDSALTFYTELLGSIDHRIGSGDTYSSTNSTLAEIGVRLRGTIKDRLGYSLRTTNGRLYGSRELALRDQRLRSNVKFNDLNSSYFDFVEAYLRADLGWFDLQFGREHARIGTGYSDRLLLSDNAPVFDAVKLDFHHKWFRFTFLHGSIVNDSTLSTESDLNKYIAMHRAQFSIGNFANIGLSEMIIYQRRTLEFAYLNPINFYKSSEHSLKDRDNAFVSVDVEVFPMDRYKLYGTWLIDDIDFSKMGTGWWGNEFGWQGGVYVAEIAGVPDVDAVIEYTRLEPYVYSNRIAGNNYTHRSIGLGHHLNPNSDEWLFEVAYRPFCRLRTWLSFASDRHGTNYFKDGNFLNVGGDILRGHSDSDPEVARFLDGIVIKSSRILARVVYEPVTNFFVSGMYEYSHSLTEDGSSKTDDHTAALRIFVEY